MHFKRLHIDQPADRSLAENLFFSAPDYALRHFGRLPIATDVDSMFLDFPESCPQDQRIVLAAFDREFPVGLVQLAQAYPEPHVAVIGLLLIPQRHRRRHLGSQILEQLSKKARGWSGVSTWRAHVLEDNSGAVEFWRRQGFQAMIQHQDSGRFSGLFTTLERPVKFKARLQPGGPSGPDQWLARQFALRVS